MNTEKKIIQATSTIQLGLPAIKPNALLVEAIKRTCNLEENVQSCFLFMKGVEQKDKPLLTLGILLTQLDKRSNNITIQNIANSLQSHLDQNQQIDLIIVNNQTQIIAALQKLEGAAIFNR